MHDEGLQVLPQLLAAANIDNAILIGHSDGGSIALIHAGSGQATPVRGVVTLAAHVFCEALSVQSIAEAKIAYETTDLRERLVRYHGDNVDVAFWGWNSAWLDPEFMQWNIEEYLPRIEVPVLAIQGEEDQYGTPAQVAAITAGAPHATGLMLPDCRHSPHRDREQATLAAIAEFVAQIG
jgi:pimeloyl-ACP methyl ester carboxylesterase